MLLEARHGGYGDNCIITDLGEGKLMDLVTFLFVGYSHNFLGIRRIQ